MKQLNELLPPVTENLELQRQETRPLKITDNEHRFALALLQPKVQGIEEETLKKCLRYVFMVVGLRPANIPSGEEKEFLHQYIRNFYGGHTCEEIRMAFDMAVQGKLPVDVTCYENFSVAYFCSIMNAFRRWASNQVREVEEKPKPATRDEIADIEIDFAFMLFKKINKLPVKIPTNAKR